MKKKMKEYDELQTELQNIQNSEDLDVTKKNLTKKIDYDLL